MQFGNMDGLLGIERLRLTLWNLLNQTATVDRSDDLLLDFKTN
jgi:hypothetical protein